MFQHLDCLAYRKGKRVTSFENKFNPNLVPILLKILNVITIEAMERKVHIQEVGVNKYRRFHILVVSSGYFVKKYFGPKDTDGKKCTTFILALSAANPNTARSAFFISILKSTNFDNSIIGQNLYLANSSSPMFCLIVKHSPCEITINP